MSGGDGVELGALEGARTNVDGGQELLVRGADGQLRAVPVAGIRQDGDGVVVDLSSTAFLAAPALEAPAAPEAPPPPSAPAMPAAPPAPSPPTLPPDNPAAPPPGDGQEPGSDPAPDRSGR